MPVYTVNTAGFLLGTYRKQGATVTLTEAQAKYFLPPHDTRLSPPAPPAPAEDPAPAAPKGKTASGETPAA